MDTFDPGSNQELDSSSKNFTVGSSFVECKYCCKAYKSQSGLWLHNKRDHFIYTKRYHLTKPSKIREFMKLHNSGNMKKCQRCDYKTQISTHLQNHIRVHINDRPFRCNLCKYSGVKKFDLTDHLKTHMKEKKYSCDICFKLYSSRGSLCHHRKIHSGKKFECSICSKKFIYPFQLKKHQSCHTANVQINSNQLECTSTQLPQS